MRKIKNPKAELECIFWDFDGVLMNSNTVRDQGFHEVLNEFPQDQVKKLMTFHQKNGGLSRYVKFRYFFEEVVGVDITEQEVNSWAMRFSEIMKRLLVNNDLLILETLNFIKRYSNEIPMIIVSGSDQNELRFLCGKLRIEDYFEGIYGSPKPKSKWIGELLELNSFRKDRCILVGDSINDYEAAVNNGIGFMGYNNKQIEDLSNLFLQLA